MYCFFHYFIDVKSLQARSYDGFTLCQKHNVIEVTFFSCSSLSSCPLPLLPLLIFILLFFLMQLYHILSISVSFLSSFLLLLFLQTILFLPCPLFSSQVCCHPGVRAAAAAVPRPLWLPPQVASDSTGAAAVQRGQPHHRGPAEKSAAAQGVCLSKPCILWLNLNKKITLSEHTVLIQLLYCVFLKLSDSVK